MLIDSTAVNLSSDFPQRDGPEPGIVSSAPGLLNFLPEEHGGDAHGEMVRATSPHGLTGPSQEREGSHPLTRISRTPRSSSKPPISPRRPIEDDEIDASEPGYPFSDDHDLGGEA